MAKGKSLSILLIICALLLTSCTKELREGDGVPFKKEIAFKATKIEAIVTKAGDVATENAKERESEKFIFLGVIGNDSLFLSAVETSATASHDLESLTKSNDSQVPQQMHIAAFKDNSTAPYANVTITSTDGWNTYSPVMYWPEFYEAVHFFASSPNEGNSLFVPSYTTGNAGYSTQLSYSVPVSEEEQTGNDAIAQTDLIYAIAPNKNETQSGAVELYFSHLLS
ncbi:MAG: fimbrillin family protein, partial [Bacteroidales bacterium]|nr:fimbrillin family protein [Bacteroidales bacterium]